MHISKRDAEAEALRIAEEFLAADTDPGDPMTYECLAPHPNVREPGYKLRKTVIKWCVTVSRTLQDGTIIDGPIVVLVDIQTKEARFL
jgi:hypothetical protein